MFHLCIVQLLYVFVDKQEKIIIYFPGYTDRALNIPIDPTTSEICYSDEYARTCGSEGVTGRSLYIIILTILSCVFANEVDIVA